MSTQTISISKDGRTLKYGNFSAMCVDIKSTEVATDGSIYAVLVVTLDSGETIDLPSTYHNAETINRRFLARAKRSDPIRASRHEGSNTTEYFH